MDGKGRSVGFNLKYLCPRVPLSIKSNGILDKLAPLEKQHGITQLIEENMLISRGFFLLIIITKTHVHLLSRSGKRCEGEEQGAEEGKRRKERGTFLK